MAYIKAFVFSVFLLCVGYGAAQEVRLTVQLGAAIPVGSFAQDNVYPKNGGFAQTGFNFDVIGSRSFSSNVVVGFTLGYAVYGLDEEGIKKVIYNLDPEQVKIESQSYQNINLQARLGYDVKLFNENLKITPLIDAGLGVFNSSSYVIVDELGNTATRKGNSGLGFMVSPGVDIRIPLNNFVDFSCFGSYQAVDYKVDESFDFTGGITDSYTETITYNYSSIHAGIGFTIRF